MENNFWDSERGKSLIKLLVWVFIITIFVLVLNFSPKSENTELKEENKPVNNENNVPSEDKIESENNLIHDNFEYTYKIIINDETTTFEGKLENKIETGYKELNDGTIVKYQKEGNIVYQLKQNEKIEINNLYENLHGEFLDFNILKTILKEYNCANLKCNFNYLNYEFNVEYNKNLLINIINETEKYELNYHFIDD